MLPAPRDKRRQGCGGHARGLQTSFLRLPAAIRQPRRYRCAAYALRSPPATIPHSFHLACKTLPRLHMDIYTTLDSLDTACSLLARTRTASCAGPCVSSSLSLAPSLELCVVPSLGLGMSVHPLRRGAFTGAVGVAELLPVLRSGVL